jgi:hypothetical protein
MKKVFLGTIIIFLALSTQAQTITKPFFGTTQSIKLSAFCKKYQCKAIMPKNGIGYTLFAPRTTGRTVLLYEYDKKKQLRYVNIYLEDEYRSNYSIGTSGSVILADLVYTALGKKFTIQKNQFNETLSRDIMDCFNNARYVPEENFEHLTRAMFTGYVTLEVEKRKVKYRVACSARFSGRTKEEWMPAFWIQLLDQKN